MLRRPASAWLLALVLMGGCKHIPDERERELADNSYQMGVYHQQQGHMQDALRELQKSLELNPDNPEALNAMGLVLHLSFNRPEEAVLRREGGVLDRQLAGRLDVLDERVVLLLRAEDPAELGVPLVELLGQARVRVHLGVTEARLELGVLGLQAVHGVEHRCLPGESADKSQAPTPAVAGVGARERLALGGLVRSAGFLASAAFLA